MQFTNFRGDHLEHTVQVLCDVRIPEAQNRDGALTQPMLSLAVSGLMSRFSMLATVEFDGEAQAGTVKIKNERPGRMLPAEVRPKLTVA